MRDLLLGRAVRDVDFVFTAAEDVFIQRNPAARKIKNGGRAIYLLNGQEHLPLAGNLPLDEAIQADLRRRDFTVNALLLSEDGVLHAHPEALPDLAQGRIRPASPTSLDDDPVRAFRAARFSAELPDFALHDACVSRMRALPCDALQAIAAEQVGKEVIKACLAEKPGNFLRALCLGRCLAPWFAEFAEADARPAGPPAFHTATVLEHTARVMDRVAAGYAACGPLSDSDRALAVWMALCHDIGKTATPGEELPKHYGHDSLGEPLALHLGQRLRLPARFIRAGGLASRIHMRAGHYNRLRPGTRVDMLMTLHAAGLFHPFLHLAAADAKKPDLPNLMSADMNRILPLSLPPAWRNKGKGSGERLRQMRCMALAASSSF